MRHEQCDECRFDGDRWTDGDLLTTLPILGALLREYAAGLDEDVLQHRHAPDQWSIAEYADHVREVLFAMRFVLGMALTTDEPDLGPAPTPKFSTEPRVIDFDAALRGVGEEGALLADELAGLGMQQWARSATIDGDRVDVRWIAQHAVHDATHHLHDIGRIRASAGQAMPHVIGSVIALHRSGGGVPKDPVTEVEVSWSGVVGDVQADRRHHGRPFQALCLWSADVIDALVAEGHPVYPGAAGENITVEGVEWATLRPGSMVRIGEVLGEISSYATPCAKNSGWFAERDFKRMDQDLHPGWSRLYAWVLEPGTIRPGDAFEVEP